MRPSENGKLLKKTRILGLCDDIRPQDGDDRGSPSPLAEVPSVID